MGIMSEAERKFRIKLLEGGGDDQRFFEIFGEILHNWGIEHPNEKPDGQELMEQAIAQAKAEGVWITTDE